MKATPPLSNDCFALPPGVHWTPVEEAHALLRNRLSPITEVETLPISAALGRILAAPVLAKRAHPPTANTAVDGYALTGAAYGTGAHRVPLLKGRSAAGNGYPGVVPDTHALRVLTGAPLPAGTDSVVLQEDVRLDADHIHFHGPLKTGANARAAGEDVVEGQTILQAGRALTPADLGLMAATGVADVPVHRRLRVAVISTGDELLPAGARARADQIFDANHPMLCAQLSEFGYQAVDLGRCPDNRDALRQRFEDAAEQADVIVTSGGASAGDEDHVSALLKETGSLALWRIAIKPGRPLALAVWSGKPVFALPGNPVAALVCLLVFARPAMRVLAGQAWHVPEGLLLPAAFQKSKKAGRREYLRARLRDRKVEVFESEGSGRISGLSWAEGLVELPDPAARVSHGDHVKFIPFTDF